MGIVITEFKAQDETAYRYAVRKYGDPNLYVHIEDGPDTKVFALCSHKEAGDLKEFWKLARGARESSAFTMF